MRAQRQSGRDAFHRIPNVRANQGRGGTRPYQSWVAAGAALSCNAGLQLGRHRTVNPHRGQDLVIEEVKV